jgi:hypothetical protein
VLITSMMVPTRRRPCKADRAPRPRGIRAQGGARAGRRPRPPAVHGRLDRALPDLLAELARLLRPSPSEPPPVVRQTTPDQRRRRRALVLGLGLGGAALVAAALVVGLGVFGGEGDRGAAGAATRAQPAAPPPGTGTSTATAGSASGSVSPALPPPATTPDLAARVARVNPFVPIAGLMAQRAPVTRQEYRWFLDDVGGVPTPSRAWTPRGRPNR